MASNSSLGFESFESFSKFYTSMASLVEISPPPPKLEEVDSNLKEEPRPSWRSLFAFTTKSHTPIIFIGLISTFIAALTKPANTIFLGKVFGSLTSFGSGSISSQELLHDVSKWCIALTALGGAAWFLEGSFLGSWMIFGELQAQCAREKLFNGMLDKDMVWFDLREDGIGSLLIRIQTQIRELQLGISQPMGFLVYEIFDAAAAISIAFYFSWQLSIVVLATFPIVSTILYFVTKQLGPAVEAQKEQLSQASKYVNNSIAAINTVKAYNGQDHEVWQYLRTMRLVAKSYMIQARINAMQFGIIKFVMVGLFVQGFWFGLYLLNHHRADAAHIVTAFYACLNAIQSIEVILPQWLVLAKAMSAGNTLKLILSEIQERPKTKELDELITTETWDGDIEVKNVTFSYPVNQEQRALENASLFFPAGETTFIVGLSGSGKSTLGNLLMKYYECTIGEIAIGGNSIKTMDPNLLRQNVNLVQQESILFNESILQNIAFGRLDHVSRADVLNACKTADLEQTFIGLPNGIDTFVDSGGRSLSGGQRQRIAIARARLRDAPILILDEATSALDQTSRPKVMEHIRNWRKNKTTIIITHDVSQIRDEEYVYVLEFGKVVQEGYRRKLAEKKHGLFSMLLSGVRTQFNTTPSSLLPRRMSMPALSPTASPTSPDWTEVALESHSTFADILLMKKATPNSFANGFRNNLRGDAGTTLGAGARHASILWADEIWKTPERKSKPTFKPPEQSESRLSKPASALFSSPKPVFRGQFKETFSVALEDSTQFQSSQVPSIQTRDEIHQNSSAKQFSNTNMQTPYPFRPGSICTTIDLPPDQGLGISETMPITTQKPLVLTTDFHTDNPTNENDIEMDDFVNEDISRNHSSTNMLKPIKLIKVFGTIWPNLTWHNRVNLILGFFFAFIVAIATPAFAYILAKLLSVYYAPLQDRQSQAIIWASALIGVAILDGVSTYIYHWLLEHCGQAWVNTLRVESLKRILAQPKVWFDNEKNSSGRLAECLDRNAEEMRNLIGRFAGPIWVTSWMLGISIVWAIIIDWKLSLVALATTPIMYAGSRLFNYVTTKYEDKCNQAAEYTSSIFTETFGNIRVVRALTLEGFFKRKHIKSTHDTYMTGLSRSLYSGVTFGFADSLSCMISALVFYYGTVLISSDQLSTSAVLQVFNLLLFGLANALATLALIPQINSSRTTATQMLFLANLPFKSSHETTGTRRIQSPFPIVLNNLSFTYPNNLPNHRTLTEVSLTIRPSTCTAIVGASGSGKSTIASLLLGLYPPNPVPLGNPPSLTFAGTPVSDLNIACLRNFISIVSQESQLFPDTIYANITYGLPEGSPHANPNAVKRAADRAGIHEFIISLGQGYNTLIGDGGQGLSGGQAQRIAIARALVRQPKVLILDEATSALDAFSAESIRNSVRRLQNHSRELFVDGMAVIIITHNVEMMSMAEEVVVIEEGRIVERGDFKELKGQKGGKLAELTGLERLSERDRVEMEGRLISPVMTPVEARDRNSWYRNRLSSV